MSFFSVYTCSPIQFTSTPFITYHQCVKQDSLTGFGDVETSRARALFLRGMKSRPGITIETEVQIPVEAHKRDTPFPKEMQAVLIPDNPFGGLLISYIFLSLLNSSRSQERI